MIWLLRHGDTEEGADDAARKLTEAGERQADIAGRALSRLGAELDACVSSPKVRALDTARIACRHLGLEPEATDALAGGDFDPVAVAASAGGGNVLLVGHEPDFSGAINATTGGRVEIKKGGLAAIEDGALVTLLRPAQIDAIAGDH